MQTKFIREYSLNRGILNCVSYWGFTDDPDDLPGDPIFLSARVEPKEPASADCMRIRVQSHSDVPPGIILGELEYFISTIKKMYEL